MQTNDNQHDDKRDYFRIQDTLLLEYRPISGPDADDGFADSSPLLGLLSELQTLEYDSQPLLRQISETDRALANYLKIVNKRVDLIAKALSLQASDQAGSPTEVTLSEGGLSFSNDQPLAVGDWVSLRLVLQPTPVGLIIPARVIRSEAQADGRHGIALGFDVLNDQQRQLLARHILQKQAQDIRAAKLHQEEVSR